jgi:rhodanese-related sulfurtransferase
MIALLMGLRTISPQDLQALIDRHAVTAIDVNVRSSWLSAHVPGALTLDPQSYTAADLPANLDGTLVFYCSNPWCRKAPNAARRAKTFGYRDVRVMSAGISGWLDAGLPTEPGAR